MRSALLVLLALGAHPALAADPVPLDPCARVDRPTEPIELPAARLDHLGGTPLERVAVMVLRDGGLVPIPFQVDERRGRKLALPEGPNPTFDDRPGVLDAEDMLVFMACDAGARLTDRRLPDALPGAGITAWRELRIDDPLDQTTGYVYVVVADHPPRTDRHYVDYDAAQDIVRAARYRVGCVGALPVYFGLALGGPLGPNVLDGLRLRAKARLRADLASWSLDESEGHHRLLAWKAGPVRVIRRSQHAVYLGLGIYLTAGTAHTFFYPEHVFAPGSLKLPFSPAVLFRDITAWGGADFRELPGWRYHGPGVPADGFAIDGAADRVERDFGGPGNWFLLSHGPEAIMMAVVMDEALQRQIGLRLLYTDDADRAAPPETARGSVPLVGFRGLDIQNLAGGRYWFQLRILGFPRYRAGAEQRALAQIARPLTADVSDRSGS